MYSISSRIPMQPMHIYCVIYAQSGRVGCIETLKTSHTKYNNRNYKRTTLYLTDYTCPKIQLVVNFIKLIIIIARIFRYSY